MNNVPKIGIIAGAGVTAGVEIANRFEKVVTGGGARQNQQHPEIVLYQATQAPSRSLHLEGKGNSFIPYYIESAKKLKNFGCSFICMPCNTAHFAIDEISAAADIEIINMIKETFNYINNNHSNSSTIGIICSDGSKKQELFNIYADNILQNHQQIIYPDEVHQQLVTKGINNVKAGLHRTLSIKDPGHPASIYFSVVNNLYKQGCDLIIIGCTEVSIAVNYLPQDLNMVDSMNILVNTSLEKYNSLLSIYKNV